MAKGGGSATPQTVTQVTSNIGEAQRPYYNILMQRAGTMLSQPYIPYGYTQSETGEVVRAVDPTTGQPVSAQRIADFTPEQVQVQKNILAQQTPGQFATAAELASDVAKRALAAGQYAPTQFGYERVNAPNLNYFQMGRPERFGGYQAAEYMSPFIQQALEPQMREAIFGARRGQLAQDLGAARQGTYGGSRQLLAAMERERNLGQQLGDIQSRGLQAAYESAQQQFERDRAAQQAAQQANLQAMLGVQQLGSQQGLQAALANQQYGLEAQRAAEQSKQFGANLGLQGIAQAGQMGQTLANIGTAQAQADQARLAQQAQTAAQQQALNQQLLEKQYQDFLTQRDYPFTQLQRYGALLSGVPQAIDKTSTEYAQQPSLGSQIMGTGLGAASIYKAFTGA